MKRYQTKSYIFPIASSSGSIEKTVELFKDMKRCTGIAIVQYGDYPRDITVEVSRNAGKIVHSVPIAFFLLEKNHPNFLPVDFPADDSVVYLNFKYSKIQDASLYLDVIFELTDEVEIKIPNYRLQSFQFIPSTSPEETASYNLDSEYEKIKGIWVYTYFRGNQKDGMVNYAYHQIEMRSSAGELILDSIPTKLLAKSGKPNLLNQFFPLDKVAAGRNFHFKIKEIGKFHSDFQLNIVLLLQND